jgi:hypothetical protein
MPKLIICCGLQGVGKSRFIEHRYPTASVADIEPWWELAPHEKEDDRWKNAKWTKARQYDQVSEFLEEGEPIIVAELSGLTDCNQAHVIDLIRLAEAYGYRTEILYLKPYCINSYLEAIEDDVEAQEFFAAYDSNKGGRFREPSAQVFRHDLTIIWVDHSSWHWAGKTDRWHEPEVFEVSYG